VMVSRNSQPAGSPSFAISSNSVRAIRRPLLIRKLPLRSGSLMRPYKVRPRVSGRFRRTKWIN
jgi:hypothetical protein